MPVLASHLTNDTVPTILLGGVYKRIMGEMNNEENGSRSLVLILRVPCASLLIVVLYSVLYNINLPNSL